MSGKQITFLVLLTISFTIALPTIPFASWCAYDGLITYPQRLERWEAYSQIRADYPNTYPTQWKQLATSSGWPQESPRRTTNKDVLTQYIMAGFFGFIGFVFGVNGLVMAILLKRSKTPASATAPLPAGH